MLADHAEEILAVTGKGAAAAPPAQKEEISPELVKAISADITKCAAIGEKFIAFIKEGESEKAVALLSDRAFTKSSRKDFLASLDKSNKVFGPLKTFAPDKKSTDFGVIDGVMTFTLKADAEYTKASVKETLRFIRNDKGAVEMIGYNRTVKE